MDAFLSTQKEIANNNNGKQEDVWVVSESHRPRSCVEDRGNNPQAIYFRNIALIGDSDLSRNIVNNTRSFRQSRATAVYQDFATKARATSDSDLSGESKQSNIPLKEKIQLTKYANGKQDFIVLTLEADITADDITDGKWMTMLNDCSANGKALLILSLETQASASCNTRRAEMIFGSLVCALWEYPKCAARLVRVIGASAVSPATCAAVLDLELENNAAEIEVVYELPVSAQSPSRNDLTNSRKVRMYDAFNRGLLTNSTIAPVYTSDDTVIITGGTGSIGLLTTRSLIRLGCKRIALVSRSGRVADADQALHADTLDLASKYQATVQIFSCDVSVKEDVDRLFFKVSSTLCAKNKGISGIIHSAGILRDGLLCSGKASGGLEAVYTAKARSCQLLCDKVIAENFDLKIFLVFSSIAAATGNAGQASYAFSNRAIEAMMLERHAKGQSGLSIRLPGVIGAGMGRTIHKSLHALMASSEHVEQTIQEVLLHAEEYSRCGSVLTMMPNELFNRMKATKLGYTLQGIDAKSFPLGHSIISELNAKLAEERRLLQIKEAEAAAAAKQAADEVVNCEEDKKTSTAETSIMRFNPNLTVQVNFDTLPPSCMALTKSPHNKKRTPRTPSNTKAQNPDTTNIEELIINIAKMLIQGGSQRELSRVDGLMTQGMDSLCAAQLAFELSDLFNLDLPQTLVLTYPSIKKIAMYIYLQGSTVNRSQARTPRSSLTSPRAASRAYTPRASTTIAEKKTAVLEEVGIIGVSMALPGDVNCLDDLWSVLTQQTSTLSVRNVDTNSNNKMLKDKNMSSFLPKITHAHRLNEGQINAVEALSHHVANNHKKSPAAINEGEFQSMHLAHKLVLFHAQQALIDAGYALDQLPTNTGVFVGVTGNLTPAPSFFHSATVDEEDHVKDGSFAATSHNLSVIAGRVSFALGLHGPSMAIDAACSSSLVALHTARRALQLHECDVAIVAGVNVLDEDTSMACAMAHMLSTDGLCRSFDSAADGYGRGEGCAVIILTRMSSLSSTSITAGSNHKKEVYGIVKGSAIKQDGASASLTAPNPIAQEMVLTQALTDAQMTVNDVCMVEAHGTGTIFGDPVEVQALAKVYETHTKTLPISASKSAFGHLEACSGLVGLFSVLLSLQHRVVPGVSNLHTLNPIVADTLKKTSLSISANNQSLVMSEGEEVLVGGVSSFGYSGTLAHVLIQAAAPEVNNNASLSAVLKTIDEVTEVEVASPLAASNAVAASVGSGSGGSGSLNHVLREYFCQDSKPTTFNISIPFTSSGNMASGKLLVANWLKEVGIAEGTVWQFSGQGSLILNAGKAFYDTSDIFRANLRRCDVVLKQQLGITAEDLLYPADLTTGKMTQAMATERLTSHTAHSQAVLVALEIALCLTLIEETKAVPTAVMGHSLGEYTAMVCAGYWSPEQALNVVCGRGLTVFNNSAACKGVMHALRASSSDVQTVIDMMRVNNTVAIAAVNGDMMLVLSGDSNDVIKVIQKLKERGVVSGSIALPVSHAFHSPLLKAAVPDFLQALRPVLDNNNRSSKMPWMGKVKFISTLRGGEVTRNELQTTDYWEQHLLCAVRYRDAVRYCISTLKIENLLEIGPQPVLTKMALQIVGTVSREERWSEIGEGRKCDVQFCLEAGK